MHRGIEIDIHLSPTLHDDDFVAKAIGNLAAYILQRDRHEPLEWQVLRVQGSGHHHHSRILKDLSVESIDELRARYQAAEREGLKPVPLRHVKEQVDFWRDDFWNYIG
jgi:hypothetical protein